MISSAYHAYFNVEKRDVKTGRWIVLKTFDVDEPKHKSFWRVDYAKWRKNSEEKRTEAVEYARTIYSTSQHDGVRVYGTADVGCTFCNICWLNGHWYDDPTQPIASDY